MERKSSVFRSYLFYTTVAVAATLKLIPAEEALWAI